MCGGTYRKSSCFCVVSLGLAWGLTAAIFAILFAWASMVWGIGTPWIDVMASAYYGYAATFVGGLWGGLWAFIQGFILGVIFGCLYNCFQCCCKSCKTCRPCEKCGDKCNCIGKCNCENTAAK